MAATKKQNIISLGIKGIEITNQSIILPADLPPILEDFAFDMTIEYRLAPPDKVLLAALSIALIDSRNPGNIPVATLGITFAYIIDNFNDIFPSTNKQSEVPQELTEIVNSISISTCRGILFSQFRGTFLNGVVLPILDPKLLNKKSS